MPIIKSAAKKMRQSEKHYVHNRSVKAHIKEILDEFRKKPTPTNFTKAMSVLDKAAKSNFVHPNKASRLKSRLSKLLKK